MPEGDTIHRTAGRLRPALAGRTVTRFDAKRLRGYRPRVGDVIAAVEARGKHLLIHFERGLVLQTHMKMTGAWHLYEAGQRWRKPAHLARVVIGVEGWEAVCFSAPDVRTFVDGAVDDPTRHLGPDLCLADADLAAAVDRFAVAEASEAIAVALLDQRIACGVGNVFKSEVLFACGLSPFTPVGEVDVDIRRRLIETAHHQLRANLGSGPRRTVPEGLAVYGRERRPCRRCGVGIRRTRQGDHARSTYWCPRCQTGAD